MFWKNENFQVTFQNVSVSYIFVNKVTIIINWKPLLHPYIYWISFHFLLANVLLACNFQYNNQQNSHPKFYIRKLENNTVSFSIDTKKIFLNCIFWTPQQTGIVPSNSVLRGFIIPYEIFKLPKALFILEQIKYKLILLVLYWLSDSKWGFRARDLHAISLCKKQGPRAHRSL